MLSNAQWDMLDTRTRTLIEKRLVDGENGNSFFHS